MTLTKSAKQAMIGLGVMLVVLVGIALLSARGNDERGLRADVLSTRRAEPGETIDIRISARDTFGAVTKVEVDFGDDTDVEVVERDPTADCRSDFARTEEFDFRHAYEGRAPFTVRATVTSGGCGAEPEEVVAVRTIDVKPLRRQ